MKTKRFGKVAITTMLCSVLMLGTSMTVFAGGGEEVEDPVVEPIFTSEETTEEVTEDMTAFTPDGNAQLVDEADEEDGKLFYTITTVNGNYFYLIIDEARDENNVYMLDMIDEQDLMTLIDEQEDDGNTTSVAATTEETAIELKTDVVVVEEDQTGDTETEKTETAEVSVEKNDKSVLIIILLVFGGGVAGGYYYLKFVKGKKENFNMDDDLEFYDDEEYENEDEQPEDNTEETESISEADSDTAEDSEEEV